MEQNNNKIKVYCTLNFVTLIFKHKYLRHTEHLYNRMEFTFFGSDNGNSVRGFGCSNFILSNDAQVICGGRSKVEHACHCLLSRYQDAINVCFPSACEDTQHHNSTHLKWGLLGLFTWLTINFLLQHKSQQLDMVSEAERCQNHVSSTLSGGHTVEWRDRNWLVWSEFCFPWPSNKQNRRIFQLLSQEMQTITKKGTTLKVVTF